MCFIRPVETIYRENYYIVISLDACEVVANLRGHEACVHSISLHSSGRFALAVSSRDSVLWDLDTFTRCRTLNGGQEVGVQNVSSKWKTLVRSRGRETFTHPIIKCPPPHNVVVKTLDYEVIS